MEKMSCIVIDNVQEDREQIHSYIEKIPFLQLNGMFHSPLEALSNIQRNFPDLLFIDIHTPDINGVEFLQMLNPKPLIIFTTAHREYAFEGFRLDAVDYLLKPIEFRDFFKAVSKATRLHHLFHTTESNENSNTKSYDRNYLIIKSNRRIHRVPIDEISYIQGMKEYVAVHTCEQHRFLYLHSLKSLEDTLPSDQFIRIHKSYIISINHVTALEGNLVCLGDTKLPIGERYKNRIMEILFT